MAAHHSVAGGDFPAAERVEFVGRRGNRLVGDLHRAGDRLGTVLVLCHGMESTRKGNKQLAIVERALPDGYSVLRFDFSYVGESEGEFADLTITGEVDDCLGALDFLDAFKPDRRILVGSSLGGAVALLAASAAEGRVDAVATIAAVAEASLFTEGLDEDELARWRATGRRRWRDGEIRSTFLEDIEAVDILSAVTASSGPLLVAHGTADEVVPVTHARSIVGCAGERARLALFDGVGHRFDEPGALDSLLDTLWAWLAEVAPAGR